MGGRKLRILYIYVINTENVKNQYVLPCSITDKNLLQNPLKLLKIKLKKSLNSANYLESMEERE